MLHPFEAENESWERPELNAAIRDAHTRCQAAGEMPDWRTLDDLLSAARAAIPSTTNA